MIRVPIDPPGLRRKLDVQWMKGIWVGRLDESDGHVVLTHMEQSPDDRCEDWQETCEYSRILWERSRVVSRIQRCLRPSC